MIKVTAEADKVCVAKANEAGQDHIFYGWDDLSPRAQRRLIQQVRSIDFQLVKRLSSQNLRGGGEGAERHVLKPPIVGRLPSPATDAERYAELRAAGEEALAAGTVSLVTLAGGAGIGPLGEPAGLLPVGPITGKSLFQLHAEKIRALNRRYRISLRWCIVTHPESDEQIRSFFKEQGYFGLSAPDLVFLTQPLLPVLDRRGRFLLSEPGRLAMHPIGHGGVLLRFLQEGAVDELAGAGIEHVSFFQSDNPMVKIADPVFLGDHIVTGAEVSSKAIRKLGPDEPVGVFCELNGATTVVEYAEIEEEDRARVGEDGDLVFNHGNLAVHTFSLAFFRRLIEDNVHLPFHAVRCTVPFISRRGRRTRPTEPNATAFRCYIFDAMRAAKKSRVAEVPREEEFSPVKAVGGPYSPQTAQRDLSRLYATWLRNGGATFPETTNGVPPTVEISPLYALDEEELKAKLELPFEVGGTVLLPTGEKRA